MTRMCVAATDGLSAEGRVGRSAGGVMRPHGTRRANGRVGTWPAILVACLAASSFGPSLQAGQLPPQVPLWEEGPPGNAIRHETEEQVRSHKAEPGSPSGRNRAFSAVSSPTCSIHRPKRPNGVGVVICPGGGFRNVWIDREGHDLAIWLKGHNVTALVLKYRTRPPVIDSREGWQDYQRAVRADGWQAIRVLRKKASALGLKPDKIGICGFSAGGHLAINCALRAEPERAATDVSAMPDFAGLFYPGISDDIGKIMAGRTASESGTPDICPMFIVNARVDRLTPADKCLDFYAMLLKAGVDAELHVFSKGAHGFGMGDGRGKSVARWPSSFVAWLADVNMIQDERRSTKGEQ